jgi:hypothetical protein
MVMGEKGVSECRVVPPSCAAPSHIIHLTKCGYLHREWTVGSTQGQKQALCVLGTMNGDCAQGSEMA